MKAVIWYIKYFIITFLISITIVFFWNVKQPIGLAQLEYACLEHKGDKSNFAHEVVCNDGQVIKNYDYIGNDWIYNRSMEIRKLNIVDHVLFIINK